MRKKKCKLRGCKTLLNSHQAKVSDFCCAHSTEKAIRKTAAQDKAREYYQDYYQKNRRKMIKKTLEWQKKNRPSKKKRKNK